MGKHTPDLFKNRSATQAFLFSHSDDRIDDGEAQEAPTDRDKAGTIPLTTRFPDLLDWQGLNQTIDTHMASAAMLITMAVEVDGQIGKKTDDEKKNGLAEDIVAPMAELCLTNNGTLAWIGRNRLAGVFPHLNGADGQTLAQRLKDAVAAAESPTVTIGIAAYPTIDYTRGQTVDNAVKALEHACFFGPGTITGFDAVSLNISGDRHYQAGDIPGAISEFKKGLLLDPGDVNLHNSIGVCYGVLKDYDKALTAFENTIRIAPKEMMAIYNKGYLLQLQGKREQALQYFLDADALEPDVFEVTFHIGQTFMEMGATEKARPYLEAATRTNSRSGPAFKSLGDCLDRLGLTKEAIQAYKRVVKMDPADAESLSTLGRLYTTRGESLDVAAVLCAQSVRLSPDSGIFRDRLGQAYLNQGRLGRALAEFEMAVALGHDSRPQVKATQARMMAAKAS